jgi:SAM-dependent methyltransferase
VHRLSLNDPVVLKNQYRDSSNLDARIALHQRFSTAKQEWSHWVFDRLKLFDGARILEVGAGTGSFWTKNLESLPATLYLVLSDLSLGMAEKAHATGIANVFVQCDTQAIPFAGGSFDVVVANHMLYHIPNLACAIEEIRRVLSPNGKLYAATNGLNHMRELTALLTELLGGEPEMTVAPFNLENGREILGRFFNHVRRFHFQDALVVTEAQPLVAYVLSMRDKLKGLDGKLDELRSRIEARITQDGAFRITKETGLFEAFNGSSEN